MGVTAIQHRVCVGLYNRASRRCISDVKGKYNSIDNDSDFCLFISQIVGFVIYTYTLILIIALAMDINSKRDDHDAISYMFYFQYVDSSDVDNLSSNSIFNLHLINFLIAILIYIDKKYKVSARIKHCYQYFHDVYNRVSLSIPWRLSNKCILPISIVHVSVFHVSVR